MKKVQIGGDVVCIHTYTSVRMCVYTYIHACLKLTMVFNDGLICTFVYAHIYISGISDMKIIAYKI